MLLLLQHKTQNKGTKQNIVNQETSEAFSSVSDLNIGNLQIGFGAFISLFSANCDVFFQREGNVRRILRRHYKL